MQFVSRARLLAARSAMALAVLMTILSGFGTAVSAQSAPDGAAFFESQVRPVLRSNCLACHSVATMNSGLALDSKESLLAGGNRGPGAKPGDLQSLILKAARHEDGLAMPPGRKLKPEQIAILEQWVTQGLPVPETFAKAKRRQSNHWAFQPVQRPATPTVAKADWARNPVDTFVLAKLEEKKLASSAPADRAVLMRRVSLDLTGLPPTPLELREFLADTRPDAYQRLVDKLLASPHYGERWARHWLDIARYADSDGYTIDAPRDIWMYRDWVINALNRDMPFSQFVVEQTAGDLLPNPTTDQLIATGFHRNTPSNYEGGIDFEQYRVEAVADRVQTTGAAFLGLTLGCARCHDHKYDPVTQREFYQIFAFLNNVDEVDKEADRKYFNKPFLEIGNDAEKKAFAEWQQAVIDGETRQRKYLESVVGNPDMDEGAKAIAKELDQLRRKKPKLPRTMVMQELPQPRESYIHLGGDFTRHGSRVEPGVPAVLPALKIQGRKPNRLDFAQWLVDRENPLTARVTVNRTWQKLFGKGFVETENDFGLQGDKPTHAELLDWLAIEFMERGWSQKALLRTIVTSATYQQASRNRADASAVDPDNRLLARQNRLRLDAEIVRDASLLSSGLLSRKVGGASVYPPLPPGANSNTQVQREWKVSPGEDRYRRGLYTFIQRSAPHPGLTVFDSPDASVTCTRRVRSNTPLQALTLMNDEASYEFATALARRIVNEAAAPSDSGRLAHGYLLTLQRAPRAAESERFLRFMAQRRDSEPTISELSLWTSVARALLNLDEFMTRE
jgi:hypothetical protein